MSDAIDPIIENFLSITLRYRSLIIASTAIATITGATLGALLRIHYEATGIVSVARIEPEGPLVDLYTIDEQLESHVDRLVVGSQLPEETHLESTVVRDQPPASTKLPMLALHATAPDAVSVRRVLDRALAHLNSLEAQTFSAEKQRLETAVRDLDQEVTRLNGAAITPKTQDALQKAIFDRAEARRALSPVRTHPSSVLAILPVEPTRRLPRVLALGMLGLVVGLTSGYVLAFLSSARSLVETRRRAV